jgi:hypothetical protein
MIFLIIKESYLTFTMSQQSQRVVYDCCYGNSLIGHISCKVHPSNYTSNLHSARVKYEDYPCCRGDALMGHSISCKVHPPNYTSDLHSARVKYEDYPCCRGDALMGHSISCKVHPPNYTSDEYEIHRCCSGDTLEGHSISCPNNPRYYPTPPVYYLCNYCTFLGRYEPRDKRCDCISRQPT